MGVSATCEKWQAKCELPVSERIEGGGSASASSSEDPGIYLLTYLLTYPGGIGGVGVRPPAELPPAGGSKPTPLEESCVSAVAERWRLEATAGAAQYAILEYAQDAHSVAAERGSYKKRISHERAATKRRTQHLYSRRAPTCTCWCTMHSAVVSRGILLVVCMTPA